MAFHDIFALDDNELVAQVRLSMKSALMIVKPSKSASGAYPSAFGGGSCYAVRYARCWGNTPQPVTVVQCGGTGA